MLELIDLYLEISDVPLNVCKVSTKLVKDRQLLAQRHLRFCPFFKD